MPPLFSVVTAVKPGGEEVLSRAYRSLLQQDLQSWQWLIQLDGPEANIDKKIVTDKRVSIGSNGRSFGAAITRNMALSRAQGKWILPLDHDDLLTPEALSCLKSMSSNKPQAQGVAFAAWVLKEGVLMEREAAPFGEGIVPAGVIPDLYRLRGGHTGIHYNAACYSHQKLLELGGWPGVAANEDSQLLTAFCSRWPITYSHQPLLVWTHHDGQTHRQEWFDKHRTEVRRLAVRRLAAMAGEPAITVEARIRLAQTAMTSSGATLEAIGLGWA